MTAFENVRNFILIETALTAIIYFVKDGKPRGIYSFKNYIFFTIISFIIYYFCGLFS